VSLYKRGEVWWYDFTIDGHRFRASTELRRKAGAQIEEDRAREAAKLGLSGKQDRTIEDAADLWFAARIKGKKSEKTVYQRLKIMLRHIGPDTLVSRIDAPQIAEAIAARRLDPIGATHKHKRKIVRVPSNSTVNRDLIDTTLRPVLTYAREVLKAPVNDIPWTSLKLSEPKERERAFTADELARWREALPEWHRPVFDFAGRYGVRLQEAFFPIVNVDVEVGRVFVRLRKNGKPHTVRLLPEDAAAMAARYGRGKAAGLDTVWFRERKGGELTPIRWRGFQSASRRALDQCKISDARPCHDLRHHAATTMMRKTGNLAAVKKLLGHENIASTMRYAHVTEDDVLESLRHTYATEPEKEAENAVNSTAATGT
jgi:integrase